MKKISAVIFDMDGVIFDSESLWRDMFVRANKHFDLKFTEQYRQSICGKNEEQIRRELRQIQPDLDVDEYRDYILNGVKYNVDNGFFKVKKGFDDLFEFLKIKGYKVGLATSSKRSRAKKMFLSKGYKDIVFDAEVYGDEIFSKAKPDPYIFRLTAEKMFIEPSECVVVEDSINGIVAAANGGFIPIMVKDLIKPDEFCRKNCWKILNNLHELQELLEELI